MSVPRVLVSPLVIQRLSSIHELSSGQLFGVKGDNELSVVGFSVTSKKTPGEVDSKGLNSVYGHDIIPHLPGNIDSLGTFVVSPVEDESHWEDKLLNSGLQVGPLLFYIDVSTHSIDGKIKSKNKFVRVEYETLKDEQEKENIYLHLIGEVTVPCNFDCDSVVDAVSSLQKKVDQCAAFQLKNSEVFILDNAVIGPDILFKSPVKNLISASKGESKSVTNFKNKCLDFNMYLKNYSDCGNCEIAPVIKYEKKSFKCAKIKVTIDALSQVDERTEVNKLYKILLESVSRNLALQKECLFQQFKLSEPARISSPKVYHFFPKQCAHFISIPYPNKMMEDDLVSTREIFHTILSLPIDIPIFRRGNACSFEPVTDNPGTVLVNPHEGLKASGVVDGEVSLVQGLYGYHHYMQDDFDDSGWGCAYRSLQTIFSWFRHQGFTGKSVPTHREIQRCLVDIGDKPASFVGSKNWIGSTEVSFVLDTLLGVSSRIVSVSSGEELSMKGGELSHHFKTQGTPIMIGGGVLAHTILGVDYNRKTGSLKFLILDPHYTGEEDLSIIQGKGWCGWKGMDFWKKNAFYNMCLPLRPKSI